MRRGGGTIVVSGFVPEVMGMVPKSSAMMHGHVRHSSQVPPAVVRICKNGREGELQRVAEVVLAIIMRRPSLHPLLRDWRRV